MNINKLHVVNFRCFKELDMDFNTQTRQIEFQNQSRTVGPLTVIIAKNGHGKTSVLDAIRIAFGTFTSAFDYPSVKHIEKKDVHIETPENTIQSVLTFPVAIHASGEIDNLDAQWSRELSKENGKSSIKNAKIVTRYGEKLKNALKMENQDSVVLPLIAFYGTGRLWKDHRNTDKDRPLLRPRDYGYDYALGNDSNYLATYQWLTNAILEENSEKLYSLKKDEVLAGQLDAIRGALNTLLKDEGYRPLLHINQKFKTLAILAPAISHQITVLTYWSLPISYLSDGVRCALSLFMDIAFRCAKLNPNLGNKACEETPGIVLIDEVDLHLHPAWQQKILNSLQFAFPKIQFIVTTHSPQVVSSVPAECIRIIEDGLVSGTIGSEGADSSRILKRVFGTEAYPKNNPVRIKLEEYLNLVLNKKQWDSTRALELRKELNSIFQGEEPLLDEADLFIENEEWEKHNSEKEEM